MPFPFICDQMFLHSSNLRAIPIFSTTEVLQGFWQYRRALFVCDIHVNTFDILQFAMHDISITVRSYGSNCILGIMKVWGFQPKSITQKPASHFLFQQFGSID